MSAEREMMKRMREERARRIVAKINGPGDRRRAAQAANPPRFDPARPFHKSRLSGWLFWKAIVFLFFLFLGLQILSHVL